MTRFLPSSLTLTALCLIPLAATASPQSPEQATEQATEQTTLQAAANPLLLKVNGEPVYASDVSLVVRNIASHASTRGVQASAEELVPMATQRVVEQKLMAQEARKRGLVVKQADVDYLVEISTQQAGGSETLAANLERAKITHEQFEESFREAVLARQYVGDVLEPQVKVTEEAVDAYYQANRDKMVRGHRVSARHILIKVAEKASSTERLAARQNANKARERALAGEPFEELAKEMSEDTTAINGGLLGFFTREEMVPSFAEAAFALGTGGISKVVETEYGFHVIKQVASKPAGPMDLEEVRNQIAARIYEERFREVLITHLEELTKKAEIEVLAQAPAEPPS